MSDSKQPVSERRLAANRANALKSTGPRTAEGKARSSLNALRHGVTGQVSIMTEEDRAAHDRFCQELIDRLQPEGPLEIQFASSIAEDFWRLQRIRALENDILALGSFSGAADIDVDHPEIHTSFTRAQTFLDHSKDFERLTLYEQRVNRSIEKNRRQLDELQEKRKRLSEAAPGKAAPGKAADPAILPQVIENPERSTENGFVFSTEEINRSIPDHPVLRSPSAPPDLSIPKPRNAFFAQFQPGASKQRADFTSPRVIAAM